MEAEYPTGEQGMDYLKALSERIRKAGRGKKYDVVVGVSGGTDSSYTVYLAKELGLRPLAAHFDNTWNSKTAVENIRNVLKTLQVDLKPNDRESEEKINSILAAFNGMDVEDEVEAMIGSHIIAINKILLHFLANTNHVNQTFDGRKVKNQNSSNNGILNCKIQISNYKSQTNHNDRNSKSQTAQDMER